MACSQNVVFRETANKISPSSFSSVFIGFRVIVGNQLRVSSKLILYVTVEQQRQVFRYFIVFLASDLCPHKDIINGLSLLDHQVGIDKWILSSSLKI